MRRVLLFCAGLSALLWGGSAGAQPVKVLVQSAYAGELAPLADRYRNLQLISVGSTQDILDKVGDADALVGVFSNIDVAAVVKAGRNLKWIQTMSAGVEGFVVVPELVQSDIILTNARIIQGPEIADHALGLLLTLTRDLNFWRERMAQGFARVPSRMPMVELRDKTALVIGLGGIGTQVAERCHAFGMRVLAIDPKDIPFMRAVERMGKPDQLNQFIPEADVIISCAPETRESVGMLGKEQFALMKDGVYIINVSRGPIVDTEALTEALRSGKVRGAGLDVTEPEPLPADHPLWSMPNVIITPHVATNSDRVFERRVELFGDNIERFLKGLPMRNVVNKERGY